MSADARLGCGSAAAQLMYTPVVLRSGRLPVCRYAVLTAAGAFVSWEKLPVDVRTLTTGSAKAVNCDDAFGEVSSQC